jgi:6-phospho-beta-glucosidase
MKIAVIGGAGVRVPLLVHGLTQSALPITEVSLFDIHPDRLETIAALARQRAGSAHVHACTELDDCLADAAFVFTSIRVGGMQARALDERVSTEHGCLGQETVGPAGFAMAMRTVPVMRRYAERIHAVCPDAWVINFTNPVGVITQAMRAVLGSRVIGICDTPTELFQDAARAMGLPPERCHFDYFGINHLGFLRELYVDGRPCMNRLWEHPELLAKVYRTPLFSTEELCALRMLPTEYVYYYLHTDRAREHIAEAHTTRGAVVERMNHQLLDDLRTSSDPVRTYEAYLQARDASYMQLEAGAKAPRATNPWTHLTGYDKIALATVQAIHTHSRDVLPLNVANGGNLPVLEPDDVIEVPCMVDSNGAHPLVSLPPAWNMPPSNVGAGHDTDMGPAGPIHMLLMQVKDYERHTIDAALSRSRSRALNALASNPIVPSRKVASALLDALDCGLSHTTSRDSSKSGNL